MIVGSILRQFLDEDLMQFLIIPLFQKGYHSAKISASSIYVVFKSPYTFSIIFISYITGNCILFQKALTLESNILFFKLT